MDTSREGAKRPVPSRNRVKPSWVESTDGPKGPLPLIPVGMATAAFSSSQTGELELSHGLIWEQDRASCRTVASIQASWEAW